MFAIIALIKDFLKIFNGSAAPWQIWLATFLGVWLGFLPLWPSLWEPALFGLIIFALALIINCHLASFLLFWGFASTLALVLRPVSVSIGNSLVGLADSLAHFSFFYNSHLSHTGYLGSALLGLILALATATAFVWLSVTFRNRIREKLLARTKMVKGAKIVSRSWTLRIVCWWLNI